MEVKFSKDINSVCFEFKLNEGDKALLENDVHMDNRSCFFELPIEFDEQTHPDLIALSVVLCVYPFVDKYIELPFSISKEFSELFYSVSKKTIGPSSNKIKPRKLASGTPALSYSGGVDSTAALALMPANTVSFFLDRDIPKGHETLYDKTAALGAVSDLVDAGYEAYSIPSDMEYLRHRVGFPVDISTAVPILLSADMLNIDSIAFGMVMESAYRIGHDKYLNYPDRIHYLRWGALFKCVGCEFFLPVAGLSEVATSIINEQFSISDMTRSCMRGDEKSSCGRCVKCFRKSLLESSISSNKIDFKLLKDNINSREVLRNIGVNKIKHENVYRFIAEKATFRVGLLDLFRSSESKKFLMELKARVSLNNENVSWMESWYPKSEELIPVQYREAFKSIVSQYLNVMTEDDVEFIEGWDVSTMPISIEKTQKFKAYLDELLESEKLRRFLDSV